MVGRTNVAGGGAVETVRVEVSKEYAIDVWYVDSDGVLRTIESSGTILVPKNTMFVGRGGGVVASWGFTSIGGNMVAIVAESDGQIWINNPSG